MWELLLVIGVDGGCWVLQTWGGCLVFGGFGLAYCSKRGSTLALALAYETRVGSPLDFQLERVSAQSCFRVRFDRA